MGLSSLRTSMTFMSPREAMVSVPEWKGSGTSAGRQAGLTHAVLSSELVKIREAGIRRRRSDQGPCCGRVKLLVVPKKRALGCAIRIERSLGAIGQVYTHPGPKVYSSSTFASLKIKAQTSSEGGIQRNQHLQRKSLGDNLYLNSLQSRRLCKPLQPSKCPFDTEWPGDRHWSL